MSTKLDHVYQSLRQLPSDRQDEVADFLSALATDIEAAEGAALTDADIRSAIEAGEASGPAEPFDFDAFMARKLAG
ncbi:MAG: type II toxin-antitoxin system ParD family antitoxin [Pseudomonadota bacterium]